MGKPFTKGDARINRRGRPKKGQSLTDILNYQLDQKKGDGRLRRETIAGKLIELAEGGDIGAIKYIMDRVDGRPRETMELKNSSLDVKLMEILNDEK